MFKINKKITLISLFISNLSFAQSDKIILAIGSGYAKPYVFIDENKNVKDGILKRFGDSIAKEMGMQIEYKVIPVKRVLDSLLDNTTNMICFENESWNPDIANKVNWTPAVFEEREVIVTPISKKLQDIKDLKGNIGTIIGYGYPNIQPLFDNGQLTREDNVNLEANFLKLKMARIDMILDEYTPTSYLIKNQHLEKEVKLWDSLSPDGKVIYNVVNRYDLKCIYNNSLDKDKVNKAFNSFKEKGLIKPILAAYGRSN